MGAYDEKKFPQLIKENCCGCTACYSICSRNSISMVADEEGFLYPEIAIGSCIKCYKCIKVCGFDALKGD